MKNKEALVGALAIIASIALVIMIAYAFIACIVVLFMF